jgi:hypothetical protein
MYGKGQWLLHNGYEVQRFNGLLLAPIWACDEEDLPAPISRIPFLQSPMRAVQTLVTGQVAKRNSRAHALLHRLHVRPIMADRTNNTIREDSSGAIPHSGTDRINRQTLTLIEKVGFWKSCNLFSKTVDGWSCSAAAA